MFRWKTPAIILAAFIAGALFNNSCSEYSRSPEDEALAGPDEGINQAVTLTTLNKRVAALEKKLKKVTVASNGDIRITGVNLYIRSGSGTTAGVVNGKGNLIIG